MGLKRWHLLTVLGAQGFCWNTSRKIPVLQWTTCFSFQMILVTWNYVSVSWLIDNALEEIEKTTSNLRAFLIGISQYQLENEKLIGLINTFSDIFWFQYTGDVTSPAAKWLSAMYMNTSFQLVCLAEVNKQPVLYETTFSDCRDAPAIFDRVYDPAMGSGGSLSGVHLKSTPKINITKPPSRKSTFRYMGQESAGYFGLRVWIWPFKWYDFIWCRKTPTLSLDDQHEDLRADFIMANPHHFNSQDGGMKN